ncbi:MAG: tetratricopeptide repeat protein [Phycisphaeraceae bacterium]
MLAEQHLQEGNLTQALAALQGAVRDDPSNAKLRVFLFQLLAVAGQWDRALTQLNVVGDLDASAMPMVHAFRSTIACEAFREQVFAGQRSPLIFGEPESWIAALVQATVALGAGQVDQARAMRDRAFDEAPAIAGRINDTPFEWIADADDRLGPVLEVRRIELGAVAAATSAGEAGREAPHA